MAFSNMSGVALVAGAGSGIGRETAYVFAERGASVVIFADLIEEAVKEAAEKSKAFSTHRSYQALAVKLDTTQKGDFERLISRIIKEFGRIDYFVNSAGVGPKTDLPITQANLGEFDQTHDVNTKGILIGIAVVSEAMSKQDESFVEGRSGRRSIGKGSIVCLASVAGMVPVPSHVQYVASKFAARGVVKTAAKELGASGIRVNAVCPSWADTPMMERNISRVPLTQQMIDAHSPLGRMAHVEEIASVIHFLSSPDASYVSGVDMVVDAGLTLMCLI